MAITISNRVKKLWPLFNLSDVIQIALGIGNIYETVDAFPVGRDLTQNAFRAFSYG